MARSLVALALVAVIATPASARERGKKAGKRKGKVVRVERARQGASGLVRMCGQIQPDGTGYCWGRAPAVGETAIIFDEAGRKASLVIHTVTPQLDGCGNATGWMIGSSARSGDIAQLSYMHQALLDWEGNARTRVIQGQQLTTMRQGENVWTAFDDDGDTVAELIITSFTCDASGAPSTQYYGGGGYCMGYYQRDGAAYTLLRTDVVTSC